jgi:hypothetical protein
MRTSIIIEKLSKERYSEKKQHELANIWQNLSHHQLEFRPVAEFTDPVRELKPALKWG